MRFSTFLLAFACVSFSQTSSAQLAKHQARSLKGVERVAVDWGPGLESDNELQTAVTLELRKTGLRLDPDSSDIVLNFSMTSQPSAFTVYVVFKMDARQEVVISRTGEVLFLVTWHYEHRERVGTMEWNSGATDQFVTAGINRFLDDYLTANGR
jgi:hypothetical protein